MPPLYSYLIVPNCSLTVCFVIRHFFFKCKKDSGLCLYVEYFIAVNINNLESPCQYGGGFNAILRETNKLCLMLNYAISFIDTSKYAPQHVLPLCSYSCFLCLSLSVFHLLTLLLYTHTHRQKPHTHIITITHQFFCFLIR